MLQRQEGNGKPGRPFEAYQDSDGNWTWGYGSLIRCPKALALCVKGERVFIDPRTALLYLYQDSLEAMASLSHALQASNIPAHSLSVPRLVALISMMFNLGIKDFLGFIDTRAAIACGDWKAAGAEMRDSDWHRHDAPSRAEELALIVETDTWICEEKPWQQGLVEHPEVFFEKCDAYGKLLAVYGPAS
jgi:GH24 family phage-related lysozyme (muramidase)